MSCSDEIRNEKEKSRIVELFKQTERMASVGGWELDLISGEIYWSDQVYRIHDVPIGEKIELENAIDFYDGEAKAIIRAAVENAAQTGQPYDLELPFITAKGRRIFVRACGEGVSENGKIVRLIGAFQDISESKRTQELHIALANKAKLAIESASLGFWDWDMETDDAHFDYLWQGMLGYEMSEVEGTGNAFFNLIHPEDRERVQAALNSHFLNSNNPYLLDLRLKTKSDSYKWIHTRGMVTERDVNNKPKRMLGIHFDVDERYKRLKEVEFARELIQKQAKELEVQKDRAEEAAKAKGQFLANISHEIRTPLHGVLDMTELLLETELKTEQLEFAKNIQSSAAHLLTTIEDILQFSGAEAKKASLNISAAMMQPFLEEIPLVFTRAIQEREIVYVEVFDPVVNALNIDKSKLRQVLINILGNAFKFADKGGAIVHQARVESETNEYVTIKFAVTDTGPGIPPSELDKIFQPFYQVDNSSTRAHGGTGLGLSISYELVRLMGGELKVKSRVECGACFFFSLTFKKSEAKFLHKHDESIIFNETLNGKALMPLNILVAEDMVVNQKIIALQLERRGHNLTFANDGVEALEIYKQKEFDLILMDINMPRMSGDQVAASIRALELGTGKHIPIIACTAHVVPEDIELYLKMGIDRYLNKPIKRLDLIEAVESVNNS